MCASFGPSTNTHTTQQPRHKTGFCFAHKGVNSLGGTFSSPVRKTFSGAVGCTIDCSAGRSGCRGRHARVDIFAFPLGHPTHATHHQPTRPPHPRTGKQLKECFRSCPVGWARPRRRSGAARPLPPVALRMRQARSKSPSRSTTCSRPRSRPGSPTTRLPTRPVRVCLCIFLVWLAAYAIQSINQKSHPRPPHPHPPTHPPTPPKGLTNAYVAQLFHRQAHLKPHTVPQMKAAVPTLTEDDLECMQEVRRPFTSTNPTQPTYPPQPKTELPPTHPPSYPP